MTNEDYLYKLYQAAVAQTPVPSSMLQPNDYMVNHLIATFDIATLLNQPKTIDRMVKPNERFEFRMKCDKCDKYIKFQRKHLEYMSNILSNTLLPLPIIARGLTVWCPYCHHKILHPKSVLGISDHKYVPTLAERAIEDDSVLSKIGYYDGNIDDLKVHENLYLEDLKVHWTIIPSRSGFKVNSYDKAVSGITTPIQRFRKGVIK